LVSPEPQATRLGFPLGRQNDRLRFGAGEVET
jgi:hypothetical protein